MVSELMAPTNRVLGEESAAEEGVGHHCYPASLTPGGMDADNFTCKKWGGFGAMRGKTRLLASSSSAGRSKRWCLSLRDVHPELLGAAAAWVLAGRAAGRSTLHAHLWLSGLHPSAVFPQHILMMPIKKALHSHISS